MEAMGPNSLAELWQLITSGFARIRHSHTADELPTANSGAKGVVAPDNATTFVDENGVMHAVSGEDSQIPLGTVLWSTSSTNPGAAGMAGTWTLRARAFVSMTDSTLYYLWEKTAQAAGDSVLPIGSVIWSISGLSPEDQGHVGTWTRRCEAFVPLTDNTTYQLYERTA